MSEQRINKLTKLVGSLSHKTGCYIVSPHGAGTFAYFEATAPRGAVAILRGRIR